MQITQKLNDSLSNLPAISNELVNTLDWAWLIDFGQGDFAKAKAMTEIALLSEWNTANLLARALVHQLQGEYNQALSLLEQAFIIESKSQHQLIAASIIYLTERKIKENLVDGFSLIPTLSNVDTLWQQKNQNLLPKVSDFNYHLIINLIQQIATILPCWRTNITQQFDLELQEQDRELIFKNLTEQLELYQEQEYYAIADFFYCCFAEILTLSGQFVAGWQLLANLAPAYLNSEKYLATAWYLMCQGDLIMETAPFGKPIVFGYRLIENDFDLITIQSLDRSVIDTATAQQQYLQARQYFNLASATRGEAMAMTRLAYLNGVQKQWHLATCGYEEAQKVFLDLGDPLNAIAAEMGYLWSYLHCEDLDTELIANLEKTANWIQRNSAVTFAMSWLLAFVAAAQEVLPQEDGIVVSQRLIKVAEIMATKGLDLAVIFDSVSCWQFWQHCHRAIANFYRYLAIELTQINDWEQAFVIGEKIRIYGIQSQLKVANQAVYLEDKLNSIIPLEQIATFLPLYTVLFSFIVTPNQLIGWAITKKGLVNKFLLNEVEQEEFKAENLEQTINIWFDNLLEVNFNSTLNRVLEHILLEPFALEIETNRHLVITTCDRIQGLSFAGLKYHHSTKSNILKKEISLNEQKTLSYLFYASQIATCELIATATNRVLIFTEEDNLINNLINRRKELTFLSLSQGLALAIAQIYDIRPLNNLTKISSEILEIMDFKPVIHLFLAETSFLLQQLVEHKIISELVILNIQDFKLKQLPSIQLNNVAQSIMNAGAKTVVTIFDREDSLATAILTSFFHQGLYFGQSIAEALRQAQKQLRLVTAQEALDFCHYLQSHIAWQNKSDRALRALITKYTGDVMVLGKDYNRATEAYAVAIKIFKNVGYTTEAQSLQNKYKMLKSLQKISKPFQGERLIFEAPAYWNNTYIYGDWQLSFVGL
jgi:hypothetical protein